MKLLQVNYDRALAQDDPDQAGALQEAAQHIAHLPGLLWKIWIYDDTAHIAGGIYLFDTDDHARAWGEGPMAPALAALPGVGAVTARYFDVADDLSVVTRAERLLAT